MKKNQKSLADLFPMVKIQADNMKKLREQALKKQENLVKSKT